MRILEKLYNIFTGINKGERVVFLSDNAYLEMVHNRKLYISTGIKYKPSFLSADGIDSNIELLKNLIKYDGDPNYLVSIVPKSERYWNAKVYYKNKVILKSKIVFSDNPWYIPTFILKKFFRRKYKRALK